MLFMICIEFLNVKNERIYVVGRLQNPQIMKSLKLQAFLKKVSKATAVVLSKNDVCELISFNGFCSLTKFQKIIEKKSQLAFFEHLDNLVSFLGEPGNYLVCIQKQFNEILSIFNECDGLINNNGIEILDYKNHEIKCDTLNFEVKEKISKFIAFQKNALESLYSKMDFTGNQVLDTGIVWNASKTDLIELTLALYESGSVASINHDLTKKEFINHMSIITRIDLENFDQVAYKMKNRENRTRFLVKLRDILDNLDSEGKIQ